MPDFIKNFKDLLTNEESSSTEEVVKPYVADDWKKEALKADRLRLEELHREARKHLIDSPKKGTLS